MSATETHPESTISEVGMWRPVRELHGQIRKFLTNDVTPLPPPPLRSHLTPRVIAGEQRRNYTLIQTKQRQRRRRKDEFYEPLQVVTDKSPTWEGRDVKILMGILTAKVRKDNTNRESPKRWTENYHRWYEDHPHLRCRKDSRPPSRWKERGKTRARPAVLPLLRHFETPDMAQSGWCP